MMYSVRIDKDKDTGGYVFKVQPIEHCIETVALDSTPGIIAMVAATDAGHACWRAWDKAVRMRYEKPQKLLNASDMDAFLASLPESPK